MDPANNGENDELEQQPESYHNWVPSIQRINKQNNILPVWKNTETMNLNHLVLENIKMSPYFRNNLYQLKTYHEILDEIFYRVTHLEPWERGTYKTAGQTGMCGGVRGVGAGGVASTPFCILFKLFTLKLTRKQLVGLLNHSDSPYIRGLGFMYIRFCQPPETFWEWYEPYLEDEEEIDPKAGGGEPMIIGQFVKLLLTKLDWYGTLFPRIPVPIQKDIDQRLREFNQQKFEETKRDKEAMEMEKNKAEEETRKEVRKSPREIRKSPRRHDDNRGRDRSAERSGHRSRKRSRSRSKRSNSRSKHSRPSASHSSRHRSRSRSKSPRSSKRDDGDRHSSRKDKPSQSKSREIDRHSSRKDKRSRSRSGHRSRSRHEHKKHKHHHRHHKHHRRHRDRRSRSKERKDESKSPESGKAAQEKRTSPDPKLKKSPDVESSMDPKSKEILDKDVQMKEEGELVDEASNGADD